MWASAYYLGGGSTGEVTIMAYGDYDVVYLGEEIAPVVYVQEKYEVVYLGESITPIQYQDQSYDAIYLGEEEIKIEYKC